MFCPRVIPEHMRSGEQPKARKKIIPGSLQGCRRRPVDRQCTTQHENKTARPSAAAALIVGHGSQQSGRFGVGATPACALPRGCKWRRGPGSVISLPTPKRDQRAAPGFQIASAARSIPSSRIPANLAVGRAILPASQRGQRGVDPSKGTARRRAPSLARPGLR